MIRALPAVVLIGLTAAECERRTPEEFARPVATAAPASPSAPSDPASAAPASESSGRQSPASNEGRCVHMTPSAPPAPVQRGPAAACPVDPEGPSGALPVGRVAFPDVSGVAVEAELVSSEHDTQRGLMYRKALDEERGMLFDLRVRADHKFWMHNTCIPLDMIFADEDGLVVGIVENAPTLDDDSRGVDCPSRWVLEVNAGWARRHGVRAGQRLVLPGAVPAR